MTLPSRKSRQITAPSIRLANRIKLSLRASLASCIALGLAGSFQLHCASAQEWQPTRLPMDSSAQPLSSATYSVTTGAESAVRPVLSSDQQLGSGMVLRWRSTAPRGSSAIDSRDTANQSTARSASSSNFNSSAHSSSYRSTSTVVPTSGSSSVGATAHNNFSAQPDSNPLRYGSGNQPVQLENSVRQANYQDSAPQWRSVNTRRQDGAAQQDALRQFGAPGSDAQQTPPSLDQFDLPNLRVPNLSTPQDNAAPNLDSPQLDLLDKPEAAPVPPTNDNRSTPMRQEQVPPYPRTLNEDRSPGDQDRLRSGQDDNSNSQQRSADLEDLDKMLQKARKASTPNCETQRDLLRGQPLSSISLDVAPRLNTGIRSSDDRKDNEKLRDEFRKRSLRRDWTDYKGNAIVNGRMTELRYGNVVVETENAEQMIPLNDLSDVDMSYIAELWNLPFRCGPGFEPLVGRDFIASTVQWKASGACHNPLYFEQVQLERYGHEAGPLVQPLLSSAHFFLTIPILPYKMGVNPMNECQYPLGYYRPGNCAPYMLQPIPLSLRGGLAQTGAVLGMAAALP